LWLKRATRKLLKRDEMRVLIAEDDRRQADFVRQALVREGFIVDYAGNGKDALGLAVDHDYDVILLDVMMPNVDGISVLKKLREDGVKSAIMMVTCQAEENDKLAAFNNGADDYLVKPVMLSELIARIRALLRRTQGQPRQGRRPAALEYGCLKLDMMKREVECRGRPLELTKKEFELLEYFITHPGRVLSQSLIAQHIWNVDFDTETKVVEVHLAHLRAKLKKAGGREIVRNVYGCGYILDG